MFDIINQSKIQRFIYLILGTQIIKIDKNFEHSILTFIKYTQVKKTGFVM